MGRKRRTFVALEIPDAVKEEAGRVQARILETGGGVRPVDPSRMHLTMKFVGDFEESRLGDLCGAVSRAAGEVAPFALRFEGVGAFPGLRKPRVVYLRCQSEPPEAIGRLHAALEEALDGVGIRREGRTFRPHVTLARVRGRPGGGLSGSIERMAGLSFGEGSAEELVVFLSELTPQGPVYTRAGGGRLGG